jgi:hypothetical protein
MITTAQLRQDFQSGNIIKIAFIGDSTTAGFCCNSYPNTWTNGLSYGCVNQPLYGPNLQPSSPYYINTSTLISDAQFNNTGIPSAIRLLRTQVEAANASSKVYNYGWSGSTAAVHVGYGTVAAIAALAVKPDVVFINLGINSAKNNQSQLADLTTLVTQCIAADMLPILVKANNIGVYSVTGAFDADSTPDTWIPMPYWQTTRAEIATVASGYNLDVVDLGSPSGALDITKLYDAFHPSNVGHAEISTKYLAYLNSIPVDVSTGDRSFRIANLVKNLSPVSNGALRFKFDDPAIGVKTLPVTLGASSAMRINSSKGILSVGTPPKLTVDYLIVGGGGGGGGNYYAGGGGAGGFVARSAFVISKGVTYNVVVGAGGAGGLTADGLNGNNSSFGAIESYGGGGGGKGSSASGVFGASGGGGGNSHVGGASWSIVSMGNNGGASVGNSGGGGGGGSGAVGANATTNAGANGGAGTSSSITGSAVTLAGGGGGAATATLTGGTGSAGGGNGAAPSGAPTAATANTGSGGGAASGWSGTYLTGGNGGSGVVIIRYPTINGLAKVTTGSPTVTTDGDYYVYQFTSTGTIKF